MPDGGQLVDCNGNMPASAHCPINICAPATIFLDTVDAVPICLVVDEGSVGLSVYVPRPGVQSNYFSSFLDELHGDVVVLIKSAIALTNTNGQDEFGMER